MHTAEQLRESWFKEDIDHLLVSVDHNNAVDPLAVNETFGGYVRHLKWGAHIPLLMGAEHYRQCLDQSGTELFYDIRLSYRQQQMGDAVANLAHIGFKRLSVGVAGTDERGLLNATLAANRNGVVLVGSISSDGESGIDKQISRIKSVNQGLDPGDQLNWVMAEARDTAKVREALSDIIITSTGIYIEGSPPDDVAERRTAGQARLAGADEIGIGNAVTFPVGMNSVKAAGLVLESFAEAKPQAKLRAV